MHLRNHAAGGFFKQTWDDSVNKGRTTRHHETRGKPTRKAHMFKIGFINRLRVVDEHTGKGAGHGVS